MSLSFVSSAVLSSTDGVSHNEEKSIESKEVRALRGKQQHKPLFEQLRSNQEEEDTKREEFQRQIMRGTRALDEEDCAHLDAIQKQKQERHSEIQSRTEEELALFRAAKADRLHSDIVVDDGDEEPGEVVPRNTDEANTSESAVKSPFVPVIVVKRKRRQPQENREETGPTKKSKSADTEGLGGLLGGYGSSDDESENER